MSWICQDLPQRPRSARRARITGGRLFTAIQVRLEFCPCCRDDRQSPTLETVSTIPRLIKSALKGAACCAIAVTLTVAGFVTICSRYRPIVCGTTLTALGSAGVSGASRALPRLSSGDLRGGIRVVLAPCEHLYANDCWTRKYRSNENGHAWIFCGGVAFQNERALSAYGSVCCLCRRSSVSIDYERDALCGR